MNESACPASTVFEIIDEREANAAGISCRFQCQDCGAILYGEHEAHTPALSGPGSDRD